MWTLLGILFPMKAKYNFKCKEVITLSELKKRELELIKILTEANDYLPVHYIAKKLNVSTKTVYRALDKLQDSDSNLIFEKKQGKGIKLKFSKTYLDNLKINKVSKYSLKERRIKILFKLLKNSKTYISLEKLSEKYYVGKSSIVNDLNYIKENLLGNNLKLSRSRKGTRIIGEEADIRSKIVTILESYSFISDEDITEYTSDRINIDTIKELSLRFNIDKLNSIEKIIKKYETKLPYTIGDLYYTNLIIHILIATQRIKNGNYVNLDNINLDVDEIYYKEAKNITAELEKEFNISFPENEIYYIYQYLVSTGVGTINSYNVIDVEENINVIANGFFKNISASNLFEIDSNQKIYYLFKLHIRALIKRLQYNISIKNPLTTQIKENYKDLFLSVKEIAIKTLDSKISDDEIAYLTVYIHLVMDKNINYKNVVLVCHSGFGTSQFLKKRLENIFPKLNIVEVISSQELKNFNFNSIDYIISTIKLEGKYNNVINVNVLLLDEDIKLINKVIFGEI